MVSSDKKEIRWSILILEEAINYFRTTAQGLGWNLSLSDGKSQEVQLSFMRALLVRLGDFAFLCMYRTKRK